MPTNIRSEVQRLKGLPSDDDIREWVQKLILCRDEIYADVEYDQYLELQGGDSSAFAAQVRYKELSEPYTLAISALNALLPPGGHVQ